MNKKSTFDWSQIGSDTFVLPSELTAYYIYKYKSDTLNKKDILKSEDVSYLKGYYMKYGGGSYVSKNDFGK